MINQLINENMVEINLRVDNWEEAVENVGSLLENSGKTNGKYTEAMINTVKEIGAYIVLSEGVAMPHARPECGVIEEGIAILSLEEPVAFGNEEYDPVKLIIGICALNHDSHINLLKEIMNILEDEELIEKVNECKDKSQLLNLIKSYN